MDKGASERIAEALLFLQDHFKHQNWTRREIAQWAGTTPETVIRTLAQFEKEGLIDQSDGRSIRILLKEKLQERAQI
ncbi:transcriptional regulator FixK [compost metagenome]